ncbi:unnamed protein product [Zymoseptoria tritici ST99CH_3D1]|nr:unnamed protein product [Zymoseptoria tritici ST99CH_3D1]
MQAIDEEALAKRNKGFQRPFEHPTPEVCAQLWAAVRQGHDEFEQFMQTAEDDGWCTTRLLCSSNERGRNFLHIAAETGDWRTIHVLVNLWIICHPPIPLYISIPRKRVPVQRDLDGNTPLHIAVIHDHQAFAKALLLYYNCEPIIEPLSVEASQEHADGPREYPVPMSMYEMEFAPRLRFLVDLKNNAGLVASQAGHAAGSTAMATWPEDFRKQGLDGIELVSGEESDDEYE